ncbi:MAG: rod shape-determining protein MreD [Candidatus Omnitrophica bacterium CG07_land_8_20_14_0_80_42_15]|uniref:Rod shape-determining protein MreD n=1 Tax=Candidatus Aquitaenariimonas noxiae TaxID=1974741 RepID=A0A2J0L4X9_9BACT|nr:MAG: rod shape-determining protein MreD [Candidatus Omnitrophica bacterium CG07_land_8_20_14_0_80_42_15]
MYQINVICIILVVLLVAIFDLTGAYYIKVCDVKPDFFLIAVLFFSLYGGLRGGLWSGFISGLVKDIFIGEVFGMNILFLTLAGLFFGYNFSKFYRERPSAQFILTFLLSVVYILFYYNFLKLTHYASGSIPADARIWPLLLPVGVSFSLYTAVAAPFFFFIFRNMFRLSH